MSELLTLYIFFIALSSIFNNEKFNYVKVYYSLFQYKRADKTFFVLSIVFFVSLCLRFYSKSLGIMPLEKSYYHNNHVFIRDLYELLQPFKFIKKSFITSVFFAFLRFLKKSSVVSVLVFSWFIVPNFSQFTRVSVDSFFHS